MRVLATVFAALISSAALAAPFEQTFLDKTMRVDYFHTGGRG